MIYEEKKTGIPATVLILAGVFLVTVSPWALELRSLYWNEGTFAAMVREIASFPPLLTLHGENASGVFPLYPLIVKIIHSCGVGMEFSLRIVPVIALAVLISIVWLCCYRASGRQAAAAGAAVMMSSMIVIDKGLEGNPILLTSLGIFACWLIWFDLGAWRGEWGLAWLASGLVAGLLFYTAGWQGLFMAVVPLLFLRRPLTLRTKPRGPGFVFGVGLILFFILAWGLPRWHAGFAGAFRPDYASPEGTGTYLVQLLVFPFEAAFRLLPWSIFAWAPFCPAIIQLDRNPLLGKYLRTLFVVLFCILWFSPETEGRDIVCLVPPLAVLIGLNYWIAVRRYGARYLLLFKLAGVAALICGIAALLFWLLPAELLEKLPLTRDPDYRKEPFLFLFGTVYCGSSILLSVLSLVVARKGIALWKLGLLVFTSFILLYWGAVVPYKAALHTRRDMGLELRRALGGRTDGLTVYKYNTLAGLYPECHYMGGRIVTVKNASELPVNEKVIYVLAPEVPSVPDRSWKSLLNREYRNQRLALWRGELRDSENDEQGNETGKTVSEHGVR